MGPSVFCRVAFRFARGIPFLRVASALTQSYSLDQLFCKKDLVNIESSFVPKNLITDPCAKELQFMTIWKSLSYFSIACRAAVLLDLLLRCHLRTPLSSREALNMRLMMVDCTRGDQLTFFIHNSRASAHRGIAITMPCESKKVASDCHLR